MHRNRVYFLSPVDGKLSPSWDPSAMDLKLSTKYDASGISIIHSPICNSMQIGLPYVQDDGEVLTNLLQRLQNDVKLTASLWFNESALTYAQNDHKTTRIVITQCGRVIDVRKNNKLRIVIQCKWTP